MNPNLAQNLDPKLKEAYDRVMGTDVRSSPEPTPKIEVKTTQFPTQPITEAPFVSPQTIKPSESFYSQTVLKPAPAKSDRKISPVIFVAVGIAFFLLYTLIWLKVFSVI